MSKLFSSERLAHHASVFLDLMGPAGVLGRDAPDAPGGGAGERLFRFAPGTTTYGGTSEILRSRIAEAGLGLRAEPGVSFDLTPTDLQLELRDSFDAFLAKEVTSTVVRDAEPLGFDPRVWTKLCELGALEMVLPGAAESVSGLWEHALLAGLVGEHVAPVPYLEAAPSRALLGEPFDRHVSRRRRRFAVISLIPRPIDTAGRQVVPNGAIADAFLARRGDTVVLIDRPPGAEPAANLASSPIAVFDAADLADVDVVARGPKGIAAWETVLTEWRLGLAAALAAIAHRTLELATERAPHA